MQQGWISEVGKSLRSLGPAFLILFLGFRMESVSQMPPCSPILAFLPTYSDIIQHPCLPMSTNFNTCLLCLPMSIHVPISSHVYPCPLMSTHVYLCPLMSTHVYPCPHMSSLHFHSQGE